MKLFTVELKRQNDCYNWYLGDDCIFSHLEIRQNLDIPKRIRRLTVTAFTKPSPNRIETRVYHDGIGLYLVLRDVIDCFGKEEMDEDLYANSVETVLKEHQLKEGTTFYLEISY
jgi:hypothetical protein